MVMSIRTVTRLVSLFNAGSTGQLIRRGIVSKTDDDFMKKSHVHDGLYHMTGRDSEATRRLNLRREALVGLVKYYEEFAYMNTQAMKHAGTDHLRPDLNPK